MYHLVTFMHIHVQLYIAHVCGFTGTTRMPYCFMTIRNYVCKNVQMTERLVLKVTFLTYYKFPHILQSNKYYS